MFVCWIMCSCVLSERSLRETPNFNSKKRLFGVKVIRKKKFLFRSILSDTSIKNKIIKK